MVMLMLNVCCLIMMMVILRMMIMRMIMMEMRIMIILIKTPASKTSSGNNTITEKHGSTASADRHQQQKPINHITNKDEY